MFLYIKNALKTLQNLLFPFNVKSIQFSAGTLFDLKQCYRMFYKHSTEGTPKLT